MSVLCCTQADRKVCICNTCPCGWVTDIIGETSGGEHQHEALSVCTEVTPMTLLKSLLVRVNCINSSWALELRSNCLMWRSLIFYFDLSSPFINLNLQLKGFIPNLLTLSPPSSSIRNKTVNPFSIFIKQQLYQNNLKAAVITLWL